MTQVTATEHQELQFTQEPIDDERKILRFLFTSFLWLVLLLFSDLFVTEMCVDCVHNDVHCLIVASTVKQIDRPGTCQTFYICCLTWNQVVTHCGRGLLRQEVPSHREDLETADKQEWNKAVGFSECFFEPQALFANKRNLAQMHEMFPTAYGAFCTSECRHQFSRKASWYFKDRVGGFPSPLSILEVKVRYHSDRSL